MAKLPRARVAAARSIADAYKVCASYKSGTLDLWSCNLLVIPDNCPRVVTGDFYCNGNSLRSLAGCPEIVTGKFSCSYNPITSLRGAPKQVGSDFWCRHTDISDIDGVSTIIGGHFVSDCFTDVYYRKYVSKINILYGSNDEAGLGSILDIL